MEMGSLNSSPSPAEINGRSEKRYEDPPDEDAFNDPD
jgi:hypothetical protein